MTQKKINPPKREQNEICWKLTVATQVKSAVQQTVVVCKVEDSVKENVNALTIVSTLIKDATVSLTARKIVSAIKEKEYVTLSSAGAMKIVKMG